MNPIKGVDSESDSRLIALDANLTALKAAEPRKGMLIRLIRAGGRRFEGLEDSGD